MRRREFIETFGAGALTALPAAGLRGAAGRWLRDFGALPAAGTTDNLWRVGLELYSVRNAMKKDPERTLAEVRKAGYDDVELLWSFDNFGRTPKQVHETLKHEGLRAPSGHIAPEVLLNGWEKQLDDAKTVGHQFLVVPSLPDDTAHSLDEWKRWADRFNSAGDFARRKGLWLMFHNEPDHMTPINNVVPYDEFIERTDASKVRLQLDFGNMEVGGGKPMAYLTKYRDRYFSFHIKDVVQDGTHDTELGAGRMNLRALLAAIADVQKKPCYVEQEAPADELISARQNYRYLKALQF